MDKVRIGLVGCGGICSKFHANNLETFDDIQIVAVADPVEERRLAMAKRFGAERVYKDNNDLYDHESKASLDAVYVCIEPCAHNETTELRAVDLGLPFLVEKPMALSMELAEKVAAGVAAKKLISAVGFQDRYLDIVDRIKDELPKHKPGGLVYGAWVGGIPMVWWWLKKKTCGGQLVEQNIHILDGLRYLFGEPKSVYATCSRGIVEGVPEYDTDDHSTAVITFANGYTATLVSGCYVKPGAKSFSGMRITLEDLDIEYRLRDYVTFATAKETHTWKTVISQGVTEDRTFINAVKSGDGSLIRSPYADAVKTLRLALAANESMETGKVITF